MQTKTLNKTNNLKIFFVLYLIFYLGIGLSLDAGKNVFNIAMQAAQADYTNT